MVSLEKKEVSRRTRSVRMRTKLSSVSDGCCFELAYVIWRER